MHYGCFALLRQTFSPVLSFLFFLFIFSNRIRKMSFFHLRGYRPILIPPNNCFFLFIPFVITSFLDTNSMMAFR